MPDTMHTNTSFQLLARGYLDESGDELCARLGDLTFTSCCQPVVSPALMRVVGVAARLVIRQGDTPLQAHALFPQLEPRACADIDRLALALHARRAARHGDSGWIFLPVQAQTIRQRLFTAAEAEAELAAIGIAPARIVLEIDDSSLLGDDEIGAFVEEYRAAGFRIALDDFGAGQSNFGRVLALHPDIVRLTPSLVQDAAASPRAARLFPHMVTLLRESGSLVLVNGVDSDAAAQLAIDADAELLQGDWFGGADEQLPAAETVRARAEALLRPQRQHADRRELRLRSRFMAVWNAYRDGRTLTEIVGEIPDAEITRLYVIDSNGFQQGDTALTAHALKGHVHPLSDARGACWARRQYFRTALEQPGRVQITRPYLSLTEQRLCITFSCVVMRPGTGQQVLCMDALLDT